MLVGDMQYHGSEALTYGHAGALVAGALVKVSMRGRSVLGIVTGEVRQPLFETKEISAAAPFAPIPHENLKLMEWLRAYYPAPLGAVVRLFVPPTEAFPKTERRTKKDEDGDTSAFNVPRSSFDSLPPLTAEQQHALAIIQEPGSYLLHGITGSGKSRVYIELTRRTLAAGKSVFMLTPEIGLTAQLTGNFSQQFGEHKIVVLHSAMTAAARRDAWYRLLATQEPVVVIGPRSALFSPVHNVGLVILDESHDQAYKNESAPHYLTSRVAAVLTTLHSGIFVSGSATPNIDDYFLAHSKQRPVIRMNQLATQADANETAITMVDMRDKNSFSRSRILTQKLVDKVTTTLQAGEQTLLFLNRRGTANVVLCSNCGWQKLCPNCDLPLTYHGDEHVLRCHTCGFTTQLPGTCPECGNSDILLKSVGTKAVLEEVQRLFPQAKVQRFDTDLGKDERLEKHIDALQAGSADILVGTQMIAKGLDLPRLSLVGIINADSSLLMPDYTATERTYQLLSQVIGRVGRGHRAGSVVVQCYDPENPTLRAALAGDWGGFYETELAERKLFKFPPFTFLLKLNCLRATSKSAESNARKLAATITTEHPGVSVEGPTPAFHPRERGKYNWQLVVKSAKRTELVAIINELPSGWSYDIDPTNLL